MNLDALESLYSNKINDDNSTISDKEIFAEEPLQYEKELLNIESFPAEDTIEGPILEKTNFEENKSFSYTSEYITNEPELAYAIASEEPIIQDTIISTEEIVTLETQSQSIKLPNFQLPTIRLPKINIPSFSLKNTKIFSELKVLIILFFIVFSAFFFFTNAKLVLITVNDVVWNEENISIDMMQELEEHTSADTTNLEKQEKLAALESNFENLQKTNREEQEMALTMQEELDKRQETHELNFNILPPTNRLIIPSLNINVPLIDVPAIDGESFENANFDDELMQWVVKYPTTANPWNQWNSLIFWHSSTERWKHNEYWFVFRNLPKLQAGDKIQVLWNGQLTTYEMIERKVVAPKEVEEYYNEFQKEWESYLTLMGCYPIWSNAKRMMVVAKKIANE